MDDVGQFLKLLLGVPFWILLLVLVIVAIVRANEAAKQATAAKSHGEELELNAKAAIQRLWTELATLQARLLTSESALAELRKQLAEAPRTASVVALGTPDAATDVAARAAAVSDEADAAPEGTNVPMTAAEVAPVGGLLPQIPGEAPSGASGSHLPDQEGAIRSVRIAPPEPGSPDAESSEATSRAAEPDSAGSGRDLPGEGAAIPGDLPQPAAPAQPPPPALAARIEPPPTLEERIGLVWFTRIGAVILLLGVAYFFKYAVDSAWIGPSGRVGLGLLAGVGVLAFAEISRPRTKPVFTHAALGIGLALLFVSAYAAHAFYDIVPSSVAFAAVFVISLLGGALAVRHHGEAILIFSSIAALVTPVLLSTGEDRPVALFGYVLLVTALTYAVSVRSVFRVAPWIGVVGSMILFLGWYEKFFDVSPAWKGEGTLTPAGKYFDLTARIVPGGFVLACAAEWFGVAMAARARKVQSFGELAYIVASSLFLHVGLTMLIHDQPVALAIGLAVLGAGSVVILRREKREALLSIPLVASFLALVPSIHGSGKDNALLMMVGLSLWASVYLIALVAPLREKTGMARGLGLALLGVVGVFLGIVAAEVLADPQPRAFSYFVLGGSALYALLGTVVAAPSLALGSMFLTLAFLLLSSPTTGTTDAPFLLIAGGWAAIYLAHSCFELLVRKSEPTRVRLVIPSLAAIGFLAMALPHTGEHDNILRAALLAGTGAVVFALGAVLLQRGAPRRAATFLLGQALAAFAAALGCLLSGGSITIAWVALASVVTILGAREKDRLWVFGGSVLFFIALSRLAIFDLEAPMAARSEYFASYGVTGSLWPRAVFNERTLSLFAMSVGFFLSARSLSRSEDKPLRSLAVLPLVLAHGFLLTLLILEVKQALLTHLPVPATPDPIAFNQLQQAFENSEAAQQTQRAMITTLLLGLYAALLLGIGFGRRSAVHRYLGLALFALTLVKLALWDVWNLPRIQQIGVLMGIGALLLGASFLYARFGKRLVTLLREGAGPTLLVILFSLAGARTAKAAEPARYIDARPIADVTAPGLYSFLEDADLWRATTSAAPFADVRLVDSTGRELPYVRRARPVPVATAVTSRAGTLVDPVKLDGGGMRAVLDLGALAPRHDHVRLDISGSGFARRTRVEVSADERDFHVIAEGGWIFRLDGASGSSTSTTLSYPASDARYLRVSILGGSDGREPNITGGEVSIDPKLPEPPVITMPAPIASNAPTPPAKGKGTDILLDLGSASAPLEDVTFVIDTPVFDRRVSIEAADLPVHGTWIGSGVLFRVGQGAPANVVRREGLRVSLRPTRTRYLRVHIEDGDDPALSVTGASVSFHPSEFVFRAESAGPVTMLLNDPTASAPSYDLAATLSRIGGGNVSAATLGPRAQNPAWHAPEAPVPPPLPLTERYRIPFIAGILVLVAALGAWAISLMRNAGPPPPNEEK